MNNLAMQARWRGALGGLVGIACAGGLGLALLGSGATPWLVAPIGASAVLVFAVPASPLAQPWPLLGGNLISAAIGIGIGHLAGVVPGSPLLAGALAVGAAIAVMSWARCLHPPGGACALLYALDAAQAGAGWPLHGAALVANVLALAGAGWLFNNLTGHSWPHRPAPVRAPARHAAEVHRALSEVLAEWDEVIDAEIEDLDAIFLAVERRIRSRQQDAPPGA